MHGAFLEEVHYHRMYEAAGDWTKTITPISFYRNVHIMPPVPTESSYVHNAGSVLCVERNFGGMSCCIVLICNSITISFRCVGIV